MSLTKGSNIATYKSSRDKLGSIDCPSHIWIILMNNSLNENQRSLLMWIMLLTMGSDRNKTLYNCHDWCEFLDMKFLVLKRTMMSLVKFNIISVPIHNSVIDNEGVLSFSFNHSKWDGFDYNKNLTRNYIKMMNNSTTT